MFVSFKQKIDARGFTLVELLVVIGIIAVLSSLVLPALARAKGKGQQIFCANNVRQLSLGWGLYAQDNNDRLAHNFGGTQIKQMLGEGKSQNWANSLLDWELSEGNTNETHNTRASLGQYISQQARVFRCPGDNVLSAEQRAASWRERSRSISMNAMIGDAGEFTIGGTNVNNPSYKQYMKLGDIAAPETIFVFIEEHPDSINDGYFLNRAYRWQWMDLPASYHNGSGNLTYADGHAEVRKWVCESTRRPAREDGAMLPMNLATGDWADFDWLMARMSTH